MQLDTIEEEDDDDDHSEEDDDTGSCKIACSFGFKILYLAMFGYG
jgi:hypothetical protein